jgi:hypothetical protein
MLLQNADDRVFGEPAALHLWSLRFGLRLPQTGSGGRRNVRRKPDLADKLDNADVPPPLLHPNMADLYAQRA